MNKRMRVYHQQLGGHTHIKIFTGRAIENGTLGKAGDLVMTNEEFEQWRNGTIELEFIDNQRTVTGTRTTAVKL